MRFCFVSIRGQNHFMTELLSVIADAASSCGHDVQMAFDEFPTTPPDTVYVVIPHEFHGFARAEAFPSRAQCGRTIALCTENPGTSWFDATVHLAPHFGARIAINRSSAAELRQRGVSCEHFQLGYSPMWDVWRRDEAVARPTDILYLGARDARRDVLVAGYGRYLWDFRCEFLVPELDERGEPAADYLVGATKHRRLASSRLLINLHRGQSRAFEWLRYLEAACNGCVMLSERTLDHEPLQPGEHFVAADAGSIPLIARHMLDETERLQPISLASYDFVRENLSMAPGVERMAALGEDLLQQSRRRAAHIDDGLTSLPPQPTISRSPQAGPEDRKLETQNMVLRALQLEVRELRRGVAALTCAQAGTSSEIQETFCTDSRQAATPRVSVLITLHNYEREIQDALASVAASSWEDLELLVLDDASSDRSLDAALTFMSARPWLNASLLHSPVNRGLAHSRNELLRRSRGEYVFILDADNGVHPPALERLVAALDEDPQASFAYSMIAVYDAGKPYFLLSSSPWKPGRLRGGNFIDAMALLRRADLIELGGYVTDPRLTGWEDFYLWCKCAEQGRRGVLVPQVLAWYRRRRHSMLLSETESSTTVAWSIMRERFPRLLEKSPPERALA